MGDALLTHPDVPVIAFTGSTEVGQHIAQITARQIKHLHLELGGKDPFVVAEDAPLEAAPILIDGPLAFGSQGNSCQFQGVREGFGDG